MRFGVWVLVFSDRKEGGQGVEGSREIEKQKSGVRIQNSEDKNRLTSNIERSASNIESESGGQGVEGSKVRASERIILNDE